VASSSGSDESSIFAVGVVIIFICLGGSQATGESPLKFFFVGLTFLIFGTIFLGLTVGITMSVIRVWTEAHKQDGRTLWEIVQEEYSAKRIAQTYNVVGTHVKRYTAVYWESESAAPVRKMVEKGSVKTRHFLYQVKEAWHHYLNADMNSDDDFT